MRSGKNVLAGFLVGVATAALAVGAQAVQDERAATGDAPATLAPADWGELRAARHAVLAVEGGHCARNPGQSWTTRFDGRGFTTTPDAGGWSWGLELVRYGWGDRRIDVSSPRAESAEGARFTYVWDDRLSEWYVNDARGLEHGYTVRARAAEADGPLVLELTIRGGLTPEISAAGRDVRFVDAAGAAALDYTGLAVYDADGRALEARWQHHGGGLRMQVEDQHACYPLTIDPLAQQAYLKASNTGENNAFGDAVAAFGDTVVVASSKEDSEATGVNGNQAGSGAGFSGAVYVFVRSGGCWSQQAYIKASNTDANDRFGTSVSLWGDTLAVGAEREDSNATGVNGDQTNDLAADSGAVYVFVRSGTTWSQQAYLKASNTDAGDSFGTSVSLSGDTLVVGAHREDSSATGVNGDQGDNGATWAGAAYVFVRNGTTWTQQAYLKASNAEAGDTFGESVALSGDTLLVGASGESSNAVGVDGDQGNNLANDSGAAYAFVRSGSTWSQEAYLKASNTGALDGFGFSASLSGSTAVVGAINESSSATGVDGDQGNEHASNSGAAYVFVRQGTSWDQQAYLKASNTGAGDRFAQGLAIAGDRIVAGAPQEDSSSSGVNGNQQDDLTVGSGAAYVFERAGTTWSQQAFLKASNTGALDAFGQAVALSGSLIVVGAPKEDSNATGVNGDQENELSVESGAAYAFDLGGAVVFCTAGTSASGCQASISAAGTPSATASSGFSLAAAAVEGQKDGLFFFGTNGRQANAWGNGTSYQCVVPPVVRTDLLQASGTSGACDGSFSLDLNALWTAKPAKQPGAGATVQAQLWYRDPQSSSNQTTSLSDAIEFLVEP